MPHESLEKRMTVPARYKRKKPRYARGQLVDDATIQRTAARRNALLRMGIKPVNTAGEVTNATGGVARDIKAQLREARNQKKTFSTQPVRSSPGQNSPLPPGTLKRIRKPHYGGGAAAPVATTAMRPGRRRRRRPRFSFYETEEMRRLT